ncbi:AAA family ATPase [Corynebacterium choanae]|uniref:Chromosome segregation protein n=1 Tax=Corynebacterium choanae TaxID=1862358 RepID=A0A3G6J6A6_9CORY|nr:AAA family ATPase [Corynebacterium choanae]AZA13631.1 chromosome segregation protein [Corynebacterium choanae]
MKIHRLEIRNVKGIDNFVLADIPDHGVVVVSGNNELGKSTVVRGLQLLLDGTPHTSGKKEIKALQQRHHPDANPFISAELTVGQTRFRVEKQYLRKKYIKLEILSYPPETLTDDKAENRLQQLLDEHMDRDLLQALFVHQGELEQEVKVKDIASITTILGGADGDADSSTDDTLLRKAQDELGEYFTEKGQERRVFKSLRDAIEEDEQKLSALADKKQQWQLAAENVEDAQVQIAAAEDQRELAKAELAELEQQAAQAVQLELKITKAKQHVVEEKHRTTTAAENVTAYTEAEKVAANAVQALADFETELVQKQQALEEEQARIEQLTRAKKNLRTTTANVEADRTVLQAAKNSVTWTREAAAAAEDTAKIEELIAQERALRRDIEDNPVTETMYDDAKNLWQRQQTLSEAIAAASPELQLQAATPTTVLVDGAPLELSAGEDAKTIEVLDPTTVQIGEVTATITPRDSGDRRAEKQRIEEELAAVFASAGVETFAELQALGIERMKAAQELSKVESTRRFAQSEDGGDQPRVRCERLLQAIADLRVSPGAVRTIIERDPVHQPHAATVEQLLDRIVDATAADSSWEKIARDFPESFREQLADVENLLQTVLDTTEQHSSRLVAELEAAEAEVEQASTARSAEKAWDQAIGQKQGLERDVERTAMHLAALGDKIQLEAALTEAQAKFEAAKASLAVLENEPLAKEIESIKGDKAAVTTELHNIEQRIEAAQSLRNKAEGRLSTLDAVAAEYDDLQQQLDSRRLDLARLERSAAAAKLLVDTLTSHLSLVQQRYSKPYSEAVNNLAKNVFGETSEVIIDEESLQIRSRRLGDEGHVEVEYLSDGAREQLALINRCAMASMVASDASAMPLIIDDPLGNSDRRRIRRMNQVLAEVGKDSQVLIFTCDPSRFDAVPDAVQLQFSALTLGG